MFQKTIKFFVISVALFIVLTGCQKHAKDPGSAKNKRKNTTVGCIVAEEYDFFSNQISYMSREFEKMGVLKGYDFSNKTMTCKESWEKLCDTRSATDIRFDRNSFYNFDELNEKETEALLQKSDVDLMIVFGTGAGTWLTDNAKKIKYDYMVFASADPVSAKIVRDEKSRYNDKSFAHVEPGRISRQIEFAWEMFHFKSIGVVYEDSDAAYSYSGIKYLEEKSKKYGYDIKRIHVKEPKSYKDKADMERYYNELKAAYAKLVPDIDILYITTGMIEDEKIPWLVEDVHKAGVYTLAETSESQVEKGAMMHITMSDAEEEGQFAANAVDEYFKGKPVDKIGQVFMITPKISLNQKSINLTGAKIPMSVYLIADKIY